MASFNEIDSRMKQECNEFKELLKYMQECYGKMDEGDTDAVYEKDVVIGFGNRIAHAKGGAATYTALEYAITYILEQEYEEYEEEETKPIGRIVKSYRINETEDPADAWYVWGQLTDGRWFGFEHPNGEVYMMEIFDNEKDAEGYYPLKVCEEIYPNDSRWMMAWTEILDDYAKHGGDSGLIETWRNAMYDCILHANDEEEGE